jgi:hypothetical protein
VSENNNFSLLVTQHILMIKNRNRNPCIGFNNVMISQQVILRNDSTDTEIVYCVVLYIISNPSRVVNIFRDFYEQYWRKLQ